MKKLSWIVVIGWYLLLVYALLAYARGVLLPAWQLRPGAAGETSSAVLSLAEAVLGAVLIILAFVLTHVAVAATARGRWAAATFPRPAKGTAFPAPVTLLVGGWVLAFALVCLVALVVVLRLPGQSTAHGAVLTMLAAGVGSSIATILGFLKHASEDQDFKPAYGAWYVGRPLIGLLLGLLFYFVVKAGFLATFPNAPQQDASELAFVAIGGLVGLFSKNAVEKLRELFSVLFQTRDQALVDFVKGLPPDVQKLVNPHLPADARKDVKAPASGEGDGAGEGDEA